MQSKQILILQRNYEEEGTNGSIQFQGEHICYSIELPWRNNLKRLSCIPAGRYMLKKKKFHKHGEQIGILNVLNREAILIHVANDAQRELMGCIAPVTKLTGSGKGAGSLKALDKLKALVYSLWDMGEEVHLLIR